MPRGACPPGHRAEQGLWASPDSAEQLPTAASPAWHVVSPPERKPGCSCNAKPWVANSLAQPSLITSQGCSQRLMTLCLRPNQLHHVTVLRLVSQGQSALAASRLWQAFARITSSGPCYSSPLAQCPSGASVPTQATEGHGPHSHAVPNLPSCLHPQAARGG